MRICIAYDCLYPWTIGGAERYLRALATALADGGHEVTFATRIQWEPGDDPSFDGVRVCGVSKPEPLYDDAGRRTISEPINYARGLAGHLLRHRYDHLHMCSFPYFSLLAARAVAPRTPTTVDWVEVWSRDYWLEYLGPVRGRAAELVQRACARATPRAFVFSDLHGRRLREIGFRGELGRLHGLYDGPIEPDEPIEPDPVVLFAGRLIPDKRATLVAPVVELARREQPDLRGVILGAGPELDAVRASLGDHTEALGFVSATELRRRMRSAAVLLLPSTREGHGMVVVEASALGVPSVVVPGPDNAALEQVEPGQNGYVAASDDPSDIAAAVSRCVSEGMALRHRTTAWFRREAARRHVNATVAEVLASLPQ